MSKLCTVCGYHCEDTDVTCPICGTPIVSPATDKPYSEPPSAWVPQPQPQTQPQIQIQPQPQTQTQPLPTAPNPQPIKKSHKTLWIVLGIVGGVLLLLGIGIFILVHLFRALTGISGPDTDGYQSTADYHEYYYPDYDSADYNSEAFVDSATEAPSSEEVSTSVESTESTETPADPSDTASAFLPEDLIVYTVESLSSEQPQSLSLETSSFSYIDDDGQLYTAVNDSYTMPAGFEYKAAATGRRLSIGTPFQDFIDAYGINSSNAIWQNITDTQVNFYYFTGTLPSAASDNELIIGWYQSGDTWTRMDQNELSAYWKNATLPACDHVLMYLIYFDDDDQTLESVYFLYGDTAYLQTYHSTWQSMVDALLLDTDDD